MKLRIILPFIILVTAGLFFYLNLNPSMPDDYQAMSAVKAHAALANTPGVRILDIRTPAEFAEGHIRDAVNIDFYSRSFESALGKLDRDALYFVYCRSGNRSSQALPLLKRLGFSRIWHLEKGIVDWNREGLPLVR